MDNLLKKLPGSTAAKAFVVAATLSTICAIPVFRSKECRQGHDYFSSDKPEAIRSGEENLRRQARLAEQKRFNSDQE